MPLDVCSSCKYELRNPEDPSEHAPDCENMKALTAHIAREQERAEAILPSIY